MTFEEAIDIGDQIFDEYLPKTSNTTRRKILVALFAELEDAGVMDGLEEPPDDEYVDESDL